ncbi:ComEA family DNA-binding protein [Ktedonospora formicarum]|uniref:Soluble ligand binding domain-containing protein n=1 Tax=Ktedonospora formicarum TaxID=2778364 RepID=A0A8J3MNV5_9CHLR|nr:ComEA family DNA-binding protein [Ktedonospora formicarum]GHO43182.1 hypothetical protein KSX_13450 [Ktedonospora formicarum]
MAYNTSTTPGSFSPEEDDHFHLAKQVTQPNHIVDVTNGSQTTHSAPTLAQPAQIRPVAKFPLLTLPQKQLANEVDLDELPNPPQMPEETDNQTAKPQWQRWLTIGLLLSLCLALFLIWQPGSTTSNTLPPSKQQDISKSTDPKKNTENSSTGATLQVYAVGAVKKPGIYTLAMGSRVYHLLAAAGGPLPNANLVALNLAAPLTDGEEIYIAKVGETLPSNVGGTPTTKGTSTSNNTDTTQIVNINTASEDEMRQVLHVSSTTAKNIINYRTQHGPYTSVDQLLQVISNDIYKRIKDMVTV